LTCHNDNDHYLCEVKRSVPIPATPSQRDRGGPRTRAEKKAATRRRVLDAAVAIALAEGFSRITVSAVARRAGLTTGAIYSNFASKEDLLLEVVGLVTPALNLTDMLEEVDDLEGLTEMVAREIPVMAKNSAKQVALAAEFQALALRDGRLRKALAASRAAAEADDPFFDWLRARNISTPINPVQWAMVVNAVATGLVFARLLDGPQWITEDVIGWVVHRLADGPE
jgi:AcrR family transcriptional regulator